MGRLIDRSQQLRAAHPSPGGSFRAYDHDHAGQPTGESHRQAWMVVVRRDPCSYCAGVASTVDHIEPRGRPTHPTSIGGHHVWLNYTAACASCNGAKGTHSLLELLYRRRWGQAIASEKGAPT